MATMMLKYQKKTKNTTKINPTTSKKYKLNKPLDQNTKTTTTYSPTQNDCYPPLSQRKIERGERSKPTTRSKPTKSTNPPPSITTQNQPNTTRQNHHQSPPPQNNKPIELQSHFLYQIQSPKLTTCWKISMEWIKNWCFLCSLEDVIKSGKNPKSHIGKERDNIWVYMLMSWDFGICGLGLLVQIIIFYYFNFWVS